MMMMSGICLKLLTKMKLEHSMCWMLLASITLLSILKDRKYNMVNKVKEPYYMFCQHFSTPKAQLQIKYKKIYYYIFIYILYRLG